MFLLSKFGRFKVSDKAKMSNLIPFLKFSVLPINTLFVFPIDT